MCAGMDVSQRNQKPGINFDSNFFLNLSTCCGSYVGIIGVESPAREDKGARIVAEVRRSPAEVNFNPLLGVPHEGNCGRWDWFNGFCHLQIEAESRRRLFCPSQPVGAAARLNRSGYRVVIEIDH